MFEAMLNALVSTPGYNLGVRAGATFLMLDRLEKTGRVFAPSVCEFHADGCDLDAYAISSDGKSASLFVTVLQEERDWKRVEELLRGAIKMFQVVSQELSPEMAALPEVVFFAERAAKLRICLDSLWVCALVVGEPLARKFGNIRLANASVAISAIDSNTLFGEESKKACRVSFPCPKPAIAVKSAGSCLTFLLTMDAAEVGRLYSAHGDGLVDKDIRPLISTNGGLIREIKKAIQKTPELVLVGNRGVTFLADAVDASGDVGSVSISSISGLRLTDGYQTVVAASEVIAKNPDKDTGALLPIKIVVQPPVGDSNVSRLTALQLHRQNKGCAQDPFGVDPIIVRLAHAFDALAADLRTRSESAIVLKNLKRSKLCVDSNDLVVTKEEIARAFNAVSGILESAQWNDAKNLKAFVNRLYADDAVIDKRLAARLAGQVILFRRAKELFAPNANGEATNALATIGKDADYDWANLCKRKVATSEDEAVILRSYREGPAKGVDVDEIQLRSVSPRVRVQVAKVSARRWFSLLAWARGHGAFSVAERSVIFRAGLASRFSCTCDIHTAVRAWSLLKMGVKHGFKVKG